MNSIIAKIIGRDVKDKTIAKNILLSFIVRFFAFLLALIKMPMYIKFFNNEEVLGIWFTILSLLVWIFNFDLGIGNGLRNNLVKVIEKDNKKETKEYISSAYISTFILIIFLGLIFLIVIPIINWNSFFNTSSTIVSEEVFQKTITIVLFGLLLQFLLKLINSIMYSLQKSFVPGLHNFISELLLLIVLFFINNNIPIMEKLPIIAIIYSICMCLPLLITSIIMFSNKLKYARPSLKSFTIKSAKTVLFIGGLFFWIQILYMIIVNTNEYLITWFIGPKYVVQYQIYNKLFSLIGTLCTLLLTPIWSMVTKALVNKDFDWINNLYKKLKRITLIAIICEFLIIPFLQILVNVWLKEDAISVNYLYAVAFAISGSLLIWNGVISTIVNGMGKLKTQFITLTIGVFINVPLAYLFCKCFSSWIGVVVANIISFIPYCVIQPFLINKYIKEFKKI